MKRWTLVLIAVAVLGLVIPAMGQELFLGLTGGMNIATMEIIGDGVEQNVDPLTLMGIGGFFGLNINNNFSIQLRPQYLQKGGTLDQVLPDPDIDMRMSFLEVDLTVKAAVGNQIRPYILIGPTIGFLITAEGETEVAGYTLTADFMNIAEKIEYGLGIGAGIEFSIWKGFLFVEGRYTTGFNNLNKGGTVEFTVGGIIADTEDIGPEDEFNNRGFQIMAGYSLPLGKK